MPVNFSMSQTPEATIHVPKHAMGMLASIGRNKADDPSQGKISQAVKGGIDSSKTPAMNKKGLVLVIDLYFLTEKVAAESNAVYSELLFLFEGKYLAARGYQSPKDKNFAYTIDRVRLLGPAQVNAILKKLYAKADAKKPSAPPLPMTNTGPSAPNQLHVATLPAHHGEEIYSGVNAGGESPYANVPGGSIYANMPNEPIYANRPT